jgi:DmsE family decaheme c-type cytochrome
MKTFAMFFALSIWTFGAVGRAQEFAPCSSCHEDVAKSFATNPHALGQRADASTCQGCHGDGQQHAESGDASLITIPKGVKGASTCLSCHGGKEGFTHAAGDAHLRQGVACDSCHSIHQSQERQLLKAEPNRLCAPCHQSTFGQFRKPFAHKLDQRSAMECVSCHNPHGGTGGKSLKETRSGEPVCLSCHVDLRGPFVFEHGALNTGSCLTCHGAHGSSNPKQLIRAQVDRLCLECHTGVGNPGLGSQPPSFHDLRSPRYRNCTTCHVAIHGSNSSPLFLR